MLAPGIEQPFEEEGEIFGDKAGVCSFSVGARPNFLRATASRRSKCHG